VAALLAEADPDLVVIAAGARPHTAPIDENAILTSTIGEAAAAAYGAESGPLDPAGVAGAILSIASGDEHPDATVLTVTADGLEVIS
jgi:hypothetical protein